MFTPLAFPISSCRVTQLLDSWREAGARVEVHDGGGYWNTRAKEALTHQLGDPETLPKVARSRCWI